MGFVLDTNIFNQIVDERFSVALLPPHADLIACHIQVDEITRTSDTDRRARLTLVLLQHVRTLLPTETAVADISRYDHAKPGDGVAYSAIKDALDARNGRKRNNVEDALIGEVALANGHTLVTADGDLAEVMVMLGCHVLRVAA